MYGPLSPTRSGKPPLAVFDKNDLLQQKPPTTGRLLLLDAVQEPGNTGALIRAAAAFDFDGVVYALPGCSPFHHACIRASAGTVFHIKHYALSEDSLAAWLTENPLPIFGADGAGRDLHDLTWPRDLVLAMGNEGHGLREHLRARLTDLVAIPIQPRVESLNVAGAAHILMYAMTRG
nr:RNA methyltransferase [Acanthopleuribacter pedis]